MLSDKAIQEFKEIFEKEYGTKLSDEEARDSGSFVAFGIISLLFT